MNLQRHIPNVERIEPREIIDKITGIFPYIDKMVIWFETEPDIDYEKLKCLCRKGKIWKRHVRMPFIKKWTFKLTLFQPYKVALRYLNRRTECNYLIQDVELALDFTARKEYINKIRQFFDMYWIQRWHKNKVTESGRDECNYDFGEQATILRNATTYLGTRRSSSNPVLYSYKPSKVDANPCCHLEIRLNRSQSVRRAKMDRFEAYTGRDCFRAFWKKRLQLRMIKKDLDYMKLAILKTLRKRYPNMEESEYSQRLNLQLKLFRFGGGHLYRAQNIIDYGSRVDAKRRFLEVIPTDKFLSFKG